MKALVYRSFGGPEVLDWVEEWERPSAAAKQILIRSAAGGVNPKDVLLRKGKFSRTLAREPLPRVSGLDIAGEVVAVGKDVSDFSVGDRVFGMTHRFSGGVHAEYAVLGGDEIAHAPSRISLIDASAVPLSAQTALQALRDLGKLSAGQKLLINGASGGVGHFAVQIAKIMGATVHAVCGSSHQEFVASLGADVVYDYAADPAPQIPSSFHCVLDVFGRYSRRDFAQQLGRKGVFVSTVPKIATLIGEFLARLGFDRRGRLVQVKSCRSDLNQLRDWIESNQLSPHVEKIYPIAHAQEAHRHIESKHTTGKVVLRFE